MSALGDEVPTLDVKGLSEKEADLQEMAKQIKETFTNTGFIGITNHNIPIQVVSMLVPDRQFKTGYSVAMYFSSVFDYAVT